MPEFLIDGKDTVAVVAAEEFKGYGGEEFLAVLDTAGRAEAAFIAKGNELHFSAVGTGIHSTAKGRVATVDHFFDVLHLNDPMVERILNNFIVVSKNLLQDVHGIIMQ